MKKFKKITIALASMLMAFTTASAITGTVAWFTAANLVSVNGMSIKAEAEEGIVISNSDKNTWTTSATAKHSGASSTFIPTSTANLSTWYHGLSDSATNGQSNVSYETFSITEAEGVNTGTTATQVQSAKNVYLLNKFYIQAAGDYTIATQDIYVKDLAIEVNDGSAAVSTELNKSLRVGIYYSAANIFAPITGSTLGYTVGGTGGTAVTAKTDGTSIAAEGHETCDIAESLTIPAYNASGSGALEFKVYVYFEGEDTAHKSANITNTLDKLSLSFKFGNKNHD